jgi:hypothetical protein
LSDGKLIILVVDWVDILEILKKYFLYVTIITSESKFPSGVFIMARKKDIVTVNVSDQDDDKKAAADSRNRKRGRGKIKIIKRQRVDNEELKKELMEFIKTKKASERLGEIFIDLVDNYATKSNFSGYSYLEEMKSRAIFFLLMYSKSFKPEKSNNAFAYCTQIVKHAFIQVIKKEKKHNETKKSYAETIFRNRNNVKKDDPLIH